MDSNEMICFCCRNNQCDNYTMYRGYLMCEFCLNDWIKMGRWGREGNSDFEDWCYQHKKELDDALVSGDEQ